MMKAPWHIKLLVIAWLPTSLFALWVFSTLESDEYLLRQQFVDFLDEQYVQELWQPIIRDRSISERLSIVYITEDDCSCNQVVQRHLMSLVKIDGAKLYRIQANDLPVPMPAIPTLVMVSEGELIYFGAFGFGQACINNGLVNWTEQQANQSLKQFWLNTSVNGCFCYPKEQ
ncbi:DUF6436 domain-containing protein [Pleionea litopenaei]|uniref:DUF6436 domain-containing protein n=1 Tax=Pleionea litopenaei TaxID=3070815 RepID=A0AA51RQB1_9GAMM|nr:DUF6436 domain-containing protein [Pleionea sp. HL-JVS1]WMS85641.1 DUF6436 domain-containing protein [Pleionea sp. HL-JVS1]